MLMVSQISKTACDCILCPSSQEPRADLHGHTTLLPLTAPFLCKLFQKHHRKPRKHILLSATRCHHWRGTSFSHRQ